MSLDLGRLFDSFFKVDSAFGFKDGSFTRKVEVSCKTADGVKVGTTSTFGDSAVTNKTKFSYSHRESGVDLKKFELDSGKNTAKVELGYSKINNISPVVSMTYGSKSEMSAQVAYSQGKNFRAEVKTDLVALANSSPNVRVESTVLVPDTPFAFLGGLNYNTDKRDPALHADVCYQNDSSVLHVQASSDTIGAPNKFTIQGRFSRGASALAFKGNHQFGKEGFKPELNLGATHQLSGDASVGALLTNDNQVFLRYNQRVSPLVNVGLNTEVLKTKGQSMGFTLSFSP